MKVKTNPTITITREEQKRIKDFVIELYDAYQADLDTFARYTFIDYIGDIIDSIATDTEETSYNTVIKYED